MIDAAEAERDEDYRLDCIAMLKAIIGQMGRHIDRLNDTERGLIDAAVNAEWEKSGTQGSIDGVIAALNARQHVQGEELAIAMRPFSSAGNYCRFERKSVDCGKRVSGRVECGERVSVKK